MKKILFSFLLICAAFTAAAADFEGILFADYYGGIEPTTGYENLRGRLYYQPTLSGSLFDYAMDYELSANLYYDFLDGNGAVAPENLLREAYVYIPFETIDLSIGQKFVAPGLVDIYSPLNCVNGEYANKLSLDDPFEGKRADALIQASWYPTYDDTIELIYVPFPRPDYEPTPTVSLSKDHITTDVVFDAEPYMFSNAHSVYLNYYHYGMDYDLQLSYGYYTDQTPGFDLTDASWDTTDLTGTIDTNYTRNHMIGGAFSTNIAGIALTEELALNLTEDFAGTDIGVRNSDITLVSQVLGSLPGGFMTQLDIVYQYIINFDAWKDSPTYNTSVDTLLAEEFNNYFTQPMQHVAFAILHIQNSFFHDRLAVSLNAGYLHPQVYLAPKVSYALTEKLQLILGGDIKTGDPSDLQLARGNQDDNFYVRVKYEY